MNSEDNAPESIDKLIEKSSLGTPGARALRRRTSSEQAASIVRASEKPARDSRTVSTSWVNRLIHGDREDRERFLAFVRPIIRRYCHARLAGTAGLLVSADVAAEDVCIAVLATLPYYRDTGGPFLAHLYGIASQRVDDTVRTAGRNRLDFRATAPDHAISPADTDGDPHAISPASLHDDIADLLALLPPHAREVVVLRVVVGLSPEETAEAIGSTPRSVREVQNRALTLLRRERPEALATLTRDGPHGGG